MKKKETKKVGNVKTISYICVIVKKKDLINTDSLYT
jgi:hypothetical protein